MLACLFVCMIVLSVSLRSSVRVRMHVCVCCSYLGNLDAADKIACALGLHLVEAGQHLALVTRECGENIDPETKDKSNPKPKQPGEQPSFAIRHTQTQTQTQTQTHTHTHTHIHANCDTGLRSPFPSVQFAHSCTLTFLPWRGRQRYSRGCRAALCQR